MTGDPHTPRRSDDAHNARPPSPSSKQPQPADALRAPISSSSFYGPVKIGSSYTGYLAPTTSPYREPQLVSDNSVSDPTSDWPDAAQHTPWDTSAAYWSEKPWQHDTNAPASVRIDERDDFQELNWFDSAARDHNPRLGPGILPPLLADTLHDPNHALYSINVTTRPPTDSSLAPSQDEARTAIPHARSYYCPDHNGWVLLLWGSSTVLPPLTRNIDGLHSATSRRKWTSSCIGNGEQPFGQVNTTHHWHRYERIIDAKMLSTPFVREQDTLLDLFLCCQCSAYCMVSELISGVISFELFTMFNRDKWNHPPPDRSPKASVIAGWETILTIIQNRLWRDEQRSLPVTRPRFQHKIGWNDNVRNIFESLEFPTAPMPNSEELGLQAPTIDPATPDGKRIRSKLLRAWAEISAWLAIYNKSKGDLGGYTSQTLFVDATEVREMYQNAIGTHDSQIARGLLPYPLIGLEALDCAWRTLGMTPATYSWELLGFAYLAQCRCDPARTPLYFTYFDQIVQTLANLGQAPPELQQLVLEERSRHRYTLNDLRTAVALLGFGRDGELGVELDADVDDKFVLEAWRNRRRQTWADMDKGAEIRMRLSDALRVVADERNSRVLRKVWDEERGSGISPETAYATLEVPKEVDETMLLTIYSMRVEDQPSQAEKMKEALSVIAEVTNSGRLRTFLDTGTDPGDATQATSPGMPRGLNQLGNTCYLNSLLQYFYTIRDLRDTITPLATSSDKVLDDSKFTDDDLKRHRVGGRLVTRREILRSKKFVHQLADLFWNLEFCENSAVTPSIDLAKLALVTSQDEEEDDISRPGTEGSNDTDATLVDDAPSHSTYDPPSPLLASPTESVLGKRPRGCDEKMDVDTQSPLHEAAEECESQPLPEEETIASSSKLEASEQVDEFETSEPQGAPSNSRVPPPLPKRPRPNDDSVMMFGRQHDVSECMDNCIFQIETALLDFQEMTGAEDDKTSVVKRLFYGKKRQRLTPLSPSDDTRHESSIHEKEDWFSHLHVNVSDEGFDLYDGLARYFDDVVDFDGIKRRMEVSLSLIDLPPLLQIQLQRAQFDRETQQAYKSQAYVKFGELLHADRFLDSADPSKKAQSKTLQAELNASREGIQRLTHDKHAPFAPALNATADFLSAQTTLALPEAGIDLVTELRKEQELVTHQLEQERGNAVQLKSRIEDIWKDDTSATYELTSVFIHRGSSPSWGHYFFYSRNLPSNPDQWFKYNDSDVSIVSKDEVFADTTGSTANPYMLVYARKGAEAIQTVHRFDPEQLQDG